jgi:outer membrane protein OmpA-like peptidoglycan-associated protein
MFKSSCKAIGIAGLLAIGGTATAAGQKPSNVQEPTGFIAGGVVGGFAAGPLGAVVGAVVGTWLGNRVHRATEAPLAEQRVVQLTSEKNELIESNHTLNDKVAQMAKGLDEAKAAQADPGGALKGVQGDVMFRTASADLSADAQHQVAMLAKALASSQTLKIRVDGYADARGTVDDNLKLSLARANTVRDILIASGVKEGALTINAYGKTKSVAADGDEDGYALDRRVRITLEPNDAAVAKVEPTP